MSTPSRTRSTLSERHALRPKVNTVISLPHLGAVDEADHFLRQTATRLQEVMAELSETWHAELGEPPMVEILGTDDLPDLMGSLIRLSGKQIRPVMCFWGWVAAGGRRSDIGTQDVLQVAVALELLHAFALIHDDVMDESVSRRGQPSVHRVAAEKHLAVDALGDAQRFGDSIAILVGDLAHAEAGYLMAQLPESMRKLWRVLVIELVLGQSRDLTGSAAGRRDLAQARQVARMKSGAYTVERPLQLGATAALATPPVISSLTAYGRQLGEAFALRDDLLGVWGDPRQTGKPAGDDLVSGKPTVIMSLADNLLAGSARDLLALVGTSRLRAVDVSRLQQELADAGVADAVEERINAHLQEAIAALETGLLAPDGVSGLTALAHRIAWRNK